MGFGRVALSSQFVLVDVEGVFSLDVRSMASSMAKDNKSAEEFGGAIDAF